MKKVLLCVVLSGSLSILCLNAETYKVDSTHSSVGFTIAHMVVSNVDGNFSKFSGKVDIDKKSKTLRSIEGDIEILSLSTRNEERDGHLFAEDYFDAKNYPKGVLKSTKIIKKKQGFMIEADLTLKGVTKKVIFDGELRGPAQNPMIKKEIFGLSLNATINRKDFNIGKDTSGATMGEDVKISINLELVPE